MEENVERLGPALLEAFKEVPDLDNPPGKRHPFPAILTLATCAMLCNCFSLCAIFQSLGTPCGFSLPDLNFAGHYL